MPRAHPADIGILIGADCAAERPSTLFAFYQRRKQILVALSFSVHLERLAARLHDLLCPFKQFRLDNTQFRPLYDAPLSFILFGTPSGQEICDLLLSVDDLARV